MTGAPERTTNLRQAHWGLIDQALSTGTNFVLSFLVARSVSAADFGAFSLVYVLFTLALGGVRATGSSVLTISAATDDERLHRTASANSGFAIGLGAVLGAGCLVAAVLVADLRTLLMVMGVAFPLLLLQDSVRGLFFAQARPRAAAANDAVWALVQFAVLIPLLATDPHPPVWQFLAAWAFGGALAAAVGLVRARVVPRAFAPHRWLTEHWRLAGPLLYSYVLAVLPAQLTFLLMPAVSSLHELGVVRAAYLFYGPLGVLFVTAYQLALPDAVRAPDKSAMVRQTRRLVSALVAIALAWSAIVVLMPESVGRLVLGPTWDLTLVSRLWLGASLVAEAIFIGAWTALSSLRMNPRIVRVQLWTSPLSLILGLSLASAYGASGAAAGLAIGYWVNALLVWRLLPRASGAGRSASPGPSGPARAAVVTEPALVAALTEQWARLPEARDRPMLAPEWAAAWATAYGDRYDTRVLTVADESGLTGILPLVQPRRARPRLELLSMRDLFEPLDAVGDVDALAGAVPLLRRPLRLARVDADSRLPDALRRAARGRALVRVWPSLGTPTLALDDSWIEPERHLNAGRRSDLRRARRRAEELGTVEIDLLCPGPSAVPALMAEVVAVESGGWKGRRGTSLGSNERMRTFFEAYARAASASGALRVGFLRIDGTPAACQLAVEWGGRLWVFKVGYDEAFARCSPGTLLMLETVRDAAKAGLRSVELLGTEEPWTRMWTQQVRPCVDVAYYGLGPWSLPALVGDTLWRASRPLRLRVHQVTRARARRRPRR